MNTYPQWGVNKAEMFLFTWIFLFCWGEGRTDSKQISRLVLDALSVGSDWVVRRGLLEVMMARRSPSWAIWGTKHPDSRNSVHRGSKAETGVRVCEQSGA